MIPKMDERVNDYFQKIYDMTDQHDGKRTLNTIISGTDYLHVAGYLERVWEINATNIL